MRSTDQPRMPRGRRIAAWIAVVVVLVLVVVSVGSYLKYREVWNSIHRVAVTDLGRRPPKYTDAENILVFGSDSRAGLTFRQQVKLHVGREGCGCSDTIMIVHISPGHHRVTVVNIPRDTMVATYQCAAVPGQSGQPGAPGQQAEPGVAEQINLTLARGGPACLWKTVEQQTGIRIDHFIELSFTGVVQVINDLGGVTVCVPSAIDDPNSGLRISRGRHHIHGATFLEFWRARYTIGDGSDLERIRRDDFLLAQVLKGVLHSRVLDSPARLVSVIGDAARAMTTDAGMTPTDLLHIAESLRGLSGENVQFIEVPTAPYPAAPAQVEFVQPQDDALFHAIAHDMSLPRPMRHKGSRGPGRPPVLEASPSQVRVMVLNGSGVAGIAGQAATALGGRGFDVVGTSDADNFSYVSSVIAYASAAGLPGADTLRAQLSDVRVVRDAALTPGTIQLTIGSSFSGLSPATAGSAGSAGSAASPVVSPSPRTSVTHLAKTYGGITGNASCSSDASAFSP